jgi:carbon monoxide dehydrogenase subunit G
MQVTLKNSFIVTQRIERVWAILSDPRQVATCMPGVEILEALDEKTFRGAVKLKLGPFSAQFLGELVIEHLDPAAHEIRMVGKGKDSTGSATMTIVGKLTEHPGGQTEMVSQSDLVISGKLAQFGARMIEDVSKSMFSKFTEAMTARLEEEASGKSPETVPRADAIRLTAVVGAVVKGAVGRLFGAGKKDDSGA